VIQSQALFPPHRPYFRLLIHAPMHAPKCAEGRGSSHQTLFHSGVLSPQSHAIETLLARTLRSGGGGKAKRVAVSDEPH
jgi:hypothetical protein